MTGRHPALPRLRYREGGRELQYTHIVTLVGRVIAVDTDWVSIHQGRRRVTQLALEDLATVLGGRDMAFGLMLDAAKQNDLIRVGLTPQRITYENSAQYQRFLDAPD